MSTSAWRVMVGEICGRRMADGDRGVGAGFFLQREQRDGFADDQRAAEHDDVLALQVDAAAREQFHDARRRARDKAGVVFLRDFAEVERVETIHVFFRGDAAKHRDFVDVLRQRRLHEDAVDRTGSAFSSSISCEEFRLRNRHRREHHPTRDADLGGGLLLFLHVGN